MQVASTVLVPGGAHGSFDPSHSPSRRVENSLQRIGELDPEIQAFVDLDAAGARTVAAELDSANDAGPLHGTPVAIKEIFDVSGLKCAWGTPIHKDRIAKRDADVVTALRAAGAIVMGTVVSSEYAIADTSRTVNPWDHQRTPGASSSGSAASVAAGMVPLAVGTQTIGSTIRPAGYCGVVGFKPTHGAISLNGVMPLSSRLDQVGLFGASIAIVRSAFDVVRHGGRESRDRSNDGDLAAEIQVLSPWGDARFSDATVDAISRAEKTFRDHGVSTRTATLPAAHADEYRCLMDILYRDMAEHHLRDYEDSGMDMDERVRGFIAKGLEISPDVYAMRVRRAEEITSELHDMLGDDGIFLTASTEGTAPLAVHGTGGRTTQRIWTLAGMPSISVPMGTVDGLPIGVQLIGPRHSENRLLKTATMLVEGVQQ